MEVVMEPSLRGVQQAPLSSSPDWDTIAREALSYNWQGHKKPPPLPVVERVWRPLVGNRGIEPLGQIVRRHPHYTFSDLDVPEKKIRQAYRSWTRGRYGKFPSSKMGRMIRARATLEYENHALREFESDVIAYVEHPVSFRYLNSDGNWARHEPDQFVRRWASDAQGFSDEFIEIKWEAEASKPELEKKWKAIGAAFASIGHTYRVVTERDLRREPRRSTLEHLLRRRRTKAPPEEIIEWTLEEVGKGGTVTIDALRSAIPELSAAQIDLLIFKGVLEIDVDAPLDSRSLIRLGKRSSDAHAVLLRR